MKPGRASPRPARLRMARMRFQMTGSRVRLAAETIEITEQAAWIDRYRSADIRRFVLGDPAPGGAGLP